MSKDDEKNPNIMPKLPNIKLKFQEKFPRPKIPNKLLAIILVGLAVVFLSIYFNWSNIFVAKVDGKLVTRAKLLKELEKQGGKQVLDTLVSEILIENEAKKRNLTVDEVSITQEMADIEENIQLQGTSLEQALADQGLTKEDLKQQIKLRKLVEQMVEYDMSITEEEIDMYIDANKVQYEEQGIDMTEPSFRDQIEQLLESFKQQTYAAQISEYVNQLKDQSDIKFYKEY